MKKSTVSFRALAALVLLAACQRELPAPQEREPLFRRIAVTLDVADDGPDASSTRSVISSDAESFREAYLFALDATTGEVYLDEGSPAALHTEARSFEWALPLQPAVMDLYAVVNPDASTRETLEGFLTDPGLTRAGLEALQYTCTDVLSLREIEGTGMPMSGTVRGLSLEGADDPLALTLRRLYARYDIRLNVEDFAAAGWSVSAAGVSSSQANTRAPYFYTGAGAGVRPTAEDLATMDFATESDIELLNTFGPDHRSTGAMTLYLLENCQGSKGPATRWDAVHAELGEGVGACSYVDFAVSATHAEKGTHSFRFRFYPGQNSDMCSNFDIVRNGYRKVCLRPRLSSDMDGSAAEGFRFIGSEGVRIAPGETRALRFETSLERPELVFERLYRGGATTEFDVTSVTWFEGNPSSPGHVTAYPYYGYATIRVTGGARQGSGYAVRGGNAAGDLRDQVAFTVSDEDSYWRDVEVLRYPEYRGEWMVVQLPESVFDAGIRLEAFVSDRVRQADGSYRLDARSTCSGEISRAVDSFYNGKTGIRKSHIWYEKSTHRLFVYCHIPQYYRENYCVLNLSVIDDDGEEEYTLYSKDYEFRVKEPLLRVKGHPDEASVICHTTITPEGLRTTDMDGFYLMLVDPDTHEPIDNQDFEWGGDNRGHSIGGRSYAPWPTGTPGFYWDNFFVESSIGYDFNEEAVDDHFALSYPGCPDDASFDFNIYNASLGSRDVRTAFPYDEDMYIAFYHSFFTTGEVRVYPVRETLAAPRREIRIMEAEAGTSDYSAMRCSSVEATQEGYLMYGFRKTYYVRLDNLPGAGTPAVSLSRSPADTPFLQYSLTSAGSGLYRLDLWVDRYEDPFTLDDTVTSYSSHNAALDDDANDRAVTVTVSTSYAGTAYQDQIVCNIIHKRFNVDLLSLSGRGLQVKMWNPLGFIIGAKARAYVALERYWYKNPLAEIIDGEPGYDSKTDCFSLVSGNISYPLSEDLPTEIEALARANRGIRSSYARALHPAFIQHGWTGDDLILYYPDAEVRSMRFELELTSRGFSTSVPGLSLNGITFELMNFITFNNDNTQEFDYTYHTQSEYYLQAPSPAEYDSDQWYYSRRYVTPTHWSTGSPQAPFTLTSDSPVHIGGNDSARTVWTRARLWDGNDFMESYQKYNPTVRF